jgi:hypothetical protein
MGMSRVKIVNLTLLSLGIPSALMAIAPAPTGLTPQTAQANQRTAAVEVPFIGTCGIAGMSLQSSLFGLPSLFCQRREVTADVLVFRRTTPPSGAIKPTTITMEPGRGALLGISFFESQLDIAGDQ